MTTETAGAEVQTPRPSMNIGSKTGFAGVLLAWAAAIAAAASSVAERGAQWYLDEQVIGLVAAAIVATLGFLAARSSQANTLTRAAAAGSPAVQLPVQHEQLSTQAIPLVGVVPARTFEPETGGAMPPLPEPDGPADGGV